MSKTLRERAVEAYDAACASQAAEQAESERQKVQRAVEELQKTVRHHSWLGVDPASINASTFEADGLTFCRGDWDGVCYGLRLVGQCSRCQEQTVSDNVHSLEYLGQLVKSFQPHARHRCQMPASPRTEPTIAEKLEELLRDIAREEIVNFP